MKSNKSILLDDDGERMVPEHQRSTLMYAEHILRYEVVSEVVRNKRVLDIASGSGYGTKIIAKTAKSVSGVDISERAVDYAKENFSSPKIDYMVGSAEDIPHKDNSFDVVVSFETLEHVSNPSKFLKEVRRVLKDKGLFIVSTPNDDEYPEGNEFHVHEYTYDELQKLLKAEFPFIKNFYQKTALSTYIDDGKNPPNYAESTYKHANKEAIYFLDICSNEKITVNLPLKACLGEKWSYIEHNRLYKELTDQHNEILKLEANIKEYRLELEKLGRDVDELQVALAKADSASAGKIKRKDTRRRVYRGIKRRLRKLGREV